LAALGKLFFILSVLHTTGTVTKAPLERFIGLVASCGFTAKSSKVLT
jgi:hypothetical protein